MCNRTWPSTSVVSRNGWAAIPRTSASKARSRFATSRRDSSVTSRSSRGNLAGGPKPAKSTQTDPEYRLPLASTAKYGAR